MTKFQDAVSLLVKVLMRKSIRVYREFSCLLIDLASLTVTAIRFSGTVARGPSASMLSSSSSSGGGGGGSSGGTSREYPSAMLMSTSIRIHR
ncbi:hypothetical protein MLD38_029764 [Melastoma candidum]|uniref:Uncharacterized protein n=1 Tax=Melastoma candidum TaxID=119954 RepID=A0ACB9N4P7_9MYRT|nr:hypothetical protein MLD38_029764 [Melastoma candidum]